MANTDQKVSAGELISATVRYNNYDDANRAYDIEGDVNINGRKVQGFSNGRVKKHDVENAAELANFNSWGENQLQIIFQNIGKSDAVLILPAVYDFMADVKTTVETTTDEASI